MMNDEPGGFRLETSRLTLRKPHRRDLPAITSELGKPQIVQNLSTAPHPYSFIHATNWFGTISAKWGVDSFTFGIYQKAAGERLIGVININHLLAVSHPRPTLGYWLADDYWGRGLMSEAVGAVLAFAFERLNAPAVEATYLEENPASGRVMEKNGFQPVAQTLLWSRFQGTYLPGHLMRCEKVDWLKQRKEFNVLADGRGD